MEVLLEVLEVCAEPGLCPVNSEKRTLFNEILIKTLYWWGFNVTQTWLSTDLGPGV